MFLKRTQFLVVIGSILVLLFFVAFFSERFLLSNVGVFIENIRFSIRTTYVSIVEGNNIKQENLLLKSKVAELEQEISQIEILRNEIDFITSNNNIVFPVSNPVIYADVLSSFDSFIEGKKIINIGEHDGIVKGDLVLAHGALVGEVEEVYKYTSEIKLLSHNDSTYAVYLEDESSAVISGAIDNQQLLLTKIPRDSQLQKGGVIKLAPTPLHPNRFPIIVGSINNIIDIPEEPFLQATVTPALEYDSLRNVYIILSQ